METLNSTQPHYIRCVKPNNALKPTIFESNNVMQQLRSGGVLEAIRIKCAGYPTYKTFFNFLDRFGILYPEIRKYDYEEKVACKWILEKMDLTGYQIGKTKVFLRAGQMAELDTKRARLLSHSAAVIQSQSRGRTAQKHYISLMQASVHIQSSCRGILARKYYKVKKKEAAAVRIQKNSRRLVSRKAYSSIRAAAIILQTVLRVRVAHSEFRCRQHARATVIIQTSWRCHRERLYYKKLKKTSIFSQSRWRGIKAQRELRKTKMTGKEEAELQHSSDAVQYTVEETGQEKEELQHSPEGVQYTVKETGQEREKLQHSPEAVKYRVEETGQEITEWRHSPNSVQYTVKETGQEVKELEHSPKAVQYTVEETGQEITELRRSLKNFQYKADETNEMHERQSNATQKANEPHCTKNTISIQVQEAEKIETLTAEVEKLKALLQVEKQRADDSERRCTEAWEVSEKRLKKLKETKKRVYQLQDSSNRLLYCMSEQFSQLKTILRSSSTSTSTSIPFVSENTFETSDNSDASSTDPGFTFPAPATNSANFSSFKPNALQLIVQDLSATEITACDKRDTDKEGAFDDYF